MKPRILLVEDDATTRAFLCAASEALPATVDSAASIASARQYCETHRYDLWLIDANLPDGDGPGLLAALRARGLRTPALAHTAAHEPDTLQALLAAGFVAALVKPIAPAALQAALRDALARRAVDPVHDASPPAPTQPGALPVWNDAIALAALGGQHAHVAALRALFIDELPAARATVLTAARDGDRHGLDAALHRLRASCGFVGAARLDATVAALQLAPESTTALTRFLDAVQEALSPP